MTASGLRLLVVSDVCALVSGLTGMPAHFVAGIIVCIVAVSCAAAAMLLVKPIQKGRSDFPKR